MQLNYREILLICLWTQLHLGLPDAALAQVTTVPRPSRINGGQQMNQSVPFQVSMQMQHRGRWRHFCSGTIISEQHVLTAAHCVDKLKLEEISVLGGTLNWKVGGQRHKIVKRHVHPQYSTSPRIVNDIAVLKVTPVFALHSSSSDIETIQMGNTDRIGGKVSVRLTGWGSITPSSAGAKVPDRLQVLNYRTISNEECVQKGFRVTANEICALAGTHGQGACMVSVSQSEAVPY